MTRPGGIAPGDLEPASAPALRDGVAWVEVDGEVVVLDEPTASLHLLDPVGGIVLQCLDGTSTLEEIAADFAAEFGAPIEVVRADILALVRDLGRRGLLDGVAEPDVHDHDHDHDEHSAGGDAGPCQ